MDTVVYVVTAYRFGGRENHSYLVGVLSSEEVALQTATDHEEYRGGKYECEVIAVHIDSNRENPCHYYVKKIFTDTIDIKDKTRCICCGADCSNFDPLFLEELDK